MDVFNKIQTRFQSAELELHEQGKEELSRAHCVSWMLLCSHKWLHGVTSSET